MEKLNELLAEIDRFSKERDWDQFHSPANLAKSVSIEAGELLECFQWNEEKYDLPSVREELADVLNYCFQMCLVLGLDAIEIVGEKMRKNGEKYPVSKAKGVATKYDKL